MMEQISEPPVCYSDWLKCFERLRTGSASREEMLLLKEGECNDAGATIVYYEDQLVKTENEMMIKFFHRFSDRLSMLMAYGEYEQLFEPFRTLARQLEGCLFFEKLDFMSDEFRQELKNSVIANALDNWRRSVRQIEKACMDGNSTILEDQLYMIRKIRLFSDREKVKL